MFNDKTWTRIPQYGDVYERSRTTSWNS